MAGRGFTLEYHHDPGAQRDGVTMTVPLIALNQVSAALADWLVPGLRREKVMLLAKSLPQKLRHKLGPLPEFADAFLAAAQPGETTLAEAIARYARREFNLVLPQDGFRPELLPAHLAMNFRIVDEHGRQLAMGRNLAQLRAELGDAALERFAEVAKSEAAGERYTDWSFGELAEVMEIRRGAQTLIGYPALVDAGGAVTLEVLDSADRARELHRAGLRRLFMLALKDQAKFIEKNLPGLQALAIAYLPFGDAGELKAQLLSAAFDRVCLVEPLPRMRAEFERRGREGRGPVWRVAAGRWRLPRPAPRPHAGRRATH